MATVLTLIVIVLAVSSAHGQQVRESLCEAAKMNAQQAVVQINDRLQRYAECVAKSSGAEDCSSEFRQLRTAQSSSESSAMQHRTFCSR